MCYLSRQSVTILDSWDEHANWFEDSSLCLSGCHQIDRLLLENWFHRELQRFTHLQLFVAKHVAISKLVWQRSHNDRRVMGPQLPPTVKVEPGLPNQLNLPITQTPTSVALKRWAWKCTKNRSRRWPAIGKG